VLFVMVAYRPLSPGAEWPLPRHWFEHSALGDLLGGDRALTDIHTLYACNDRLLEHLIEARAFARSASRAPQNSSSPSCCHSRAAHGNTRGQQLPAGQPGAGTQSSAAFDRHAAGVVPDHRRKARVKALASA
jgi:hypothetical protein